MKSRMASRGKIRAPVLAAGGIVLREAAPPLVAIVRLRKNKAWVLPKGKLKPGEEPLDAARREVMEETGHDVTVHEYLGEMASEPGAKPKTVRFWRMGAAGQPTRKLMRDVRAVKWLPLEQAIERLTHPHERAFLRRVGPDALRTAGLPAGGTPAQPPLVARLRSWLRRLWRG
jgi:8-oxo-dGTP diphosphatase